MKTLRKIAPIITAFSIVAMGYSQTIDLEDQLAIHLSLTGNADDESKNNIPTTVIGATLTEDRYGNPNQAYKFDGIDDRIVLNNNNPIITSNTFSICMWAKMDGKSLSERVQNILFEQRDDDSALASAKSSITFCSDKNNYAQLAIRGSIPGEEPVIIESDRQNYHEWHHYAITFDDHLNAKIYIDAHLSNVKAFSGNCNFHTSIDHVDIGTHQYRNKIMGAFNGVIDDVYIYNRAINECEISVLYGLMMQER